MKTALGLVGLFCLAQQACSLSPGDRYQVHYSPNVSDPVHQVVQQELEQWSEAVGVRFDVYQGGDCQMQSNCIYVQIATAQVGEDTTSGYQEGETDTNLANQNSTLHLRNTTPAADLPRCALHEIGHALGMLHSNDPKYHLTDSERRGAIMYPYWTGTHPSATLTDADIRMYWQERGK